jgi:4-hydroxy-tetrahydrodipicolinate reductase
VAERIKVAVVGAAGRMGSEVCRAVESADDLELVGRYDVGDDLGDVDGADVAVDFTVPDAALDNVLNLVQRGVHVVVGTTGWTEDKLERVREALAQRPETGVLIAPNFAIGALLLQLFAERAARFYESAEVVELHHPDKVDAPSGTAVRTARGIAAARASAGLGPSPDATVSDPEGARGATIDGVHVHAVRLRGLVAHEEILFGGPGEQLTLRHDSFDRASFMPGVLAGIRAVVDRPGLTVGLERILDL